MHHSTWNTVTYCIHHAFSSHLIDNFWFTKDYGKDNLGRGRLRLNLQGASIPKRAKLAAFPHGAGRMTHVVT